MNLFCKLYTVFESYSKSLIMCNFGHFGDTFGDFQTLCCCILSSHGSNEKFLLEHCSWRIIYPHGRLSPGSKSPRQIPGRPWWGNTQMGTQTQILNTLFSYRILSRHKVILSIWRIFMWNPNWKKRKNFVTYAKFFNMISNLSELKVKKKWNFCGLRMTVDICTLFENYTKCRIQFFQFWLVTLF